VVKIATQTNSKQKELLYNMQLIVQKLEERYV